MFLGLENIKKIEMEIRKLMKKEIPPNAGFDLLSQRMAFSSMFLIPRFLENLINKPFIISEKSAEKPTKIKKNKM